MVLSGKSVVVATSTSSGKSLCYNIPVVETLSKNSVACALYVFPTKVFFFFSFIYLFIHRIFLSFGLCGNIFREFPISTLQTKLRLKD